MAGDGEVRIFDLHEHHDDMTGTSDSPLTLTQRLKHPRRKLQVTAPGLRSPSTRVEAVKLAPDGESLATLENETVHVYV